MRKYTSRSKRPYHVSKHQQPIPTKPLKEAWPWPSLDYVNLLRRRAMDIGKHSNFKAKNVFLYYMIVYS